MNVMHEHILSCRSCKTPLQVSDPLAVNTRISPKHHRWLAIAHEYSTAKTTNELVKKTPHLTPLEEPDLDINRFQELDPEELIVSRHFLCMEDVTTLKSRLSFARFWNLDSTTFEKRFQEVSRWAGTKTILSK
ncbi:hypothetical protein VM1G_11421 [Cytospora mali]|uniref:Uncharacterized protein n=1 Tax=Cytospora mali TaxID=578113 RepID=A0A194VRT5_CYTMA|nr:hypothetical protein VM1G_11421 [Valsa mali]